MRIARICLYQVDLPQKTSRSISGDRRIDDLDSTIVAIETDTGLKGWGEACPFGPQYLPNFAEGVRAGMQVMAPQLIGSDPGNPGAVYQLMDRTMMGQQLVKAAFDNACWDILGQSLGAPVHQLLGGKLQESVQQQAFIAREDGPEAMAERIRELRPEGRRHYEIKATGDPAADIELLRFVTGELESGELLKIDANGGWQVHEAQRVMAALPDAAILYEQPCATYQQCKALRRLSGRPIILDETAVTLEDVAVAFADGVASGINLKIARVGGLSKARAMRDLCLGLGLPLIIQCVGGSDFTGAAIAHLAQTIPSKSLLSVWNAAAMLKVRTAEGMPALDGRMQAGPDAGLGLEPLMDVLGDPIAAYE